MLKRFSLIPVAYYGLGIIYLEVISCSFIGTVLRAGFLLLLKILTGITDDRKSRADAKF